MLIAHLNVLITEILNCENLSVSALAKKLNTSTQTLYRARKNERISWASERKILLYYLSRVHFKSKNRPHSRLKHPHTHLS